MLSAPGAEAESLRYDSGSVDLNNHGKKKKTQAVVGRLRFVFWALRPNVQSYDLRFMNQ